MSLPNYTPETVILGDDPHSVANTELVRFVTPLLALVAGLPAGLASLGEVLDWWSIGDSLRAVLLAGWAAVVAAGTALAVRIQRSGVFSRRTVADLIGDEVPDSEMNLPDPRSAVPPEEWGGEPFMPES